MSGGRKGRSDGEEDGQVVVATRRREVSGTETTRVEAWREVTHREKITSSATTDGGMRNSLDDATTSGQSLPCS